MLLSLLVSLYTSRIVLQALGVEDFGVYNVVGGIIGFMSFLTSSLSGATSRFISFELGKGNLSNLRDTFSSAFLIDLMLGVAIIFIGETFGYWFLNNRLEIPEDSLNAANWVYQFTIIGMVVSVTQIPYTALVIAHEKMMMYAYVELFAVCLRLLMAYLLLIISSNHLIWYAGMVTAINLIMAMIYRVYCIRKFKESHFKFMWRPKILRPLFSFSGWDLLGNVSWTIRVQGIVIMINLFFGVVINAAYSIANNITNSVLSFSTNIMTAYRPQIIKCYAENALGNFSNLIIDGFKFALIAMLCIAIPLCVEVDSVLVLWLKNPPYMTNILSQLALLTAVVGIANFPIHIGIQATGKIKILNIFISIIYLSVVGCSYIALKSGFDVKWIFYIAIVLNIILFIISVAIIKRLVIEFQCRNLIITAVKLICSGIVTYIFALLIKGMFVPGFLRLLLITVISISVLALFTFAFLLTHSERHKVQEFTFSFFKKLLNKSKHE